MLTNYYIHLLRDYIKIKVVIIMNIDLSVFKEYDIRGVYPTSINDDLAYLIGKAYGSYIQEKFNKKDCVVSHDNRLSSEALSSNLIKGLLETGCNVINYGLTTTPMNYYGRYLNNMLGVMITASHNPKDDNGFKFSFDNLANARGKMIEEFRDYLLAGKFLEGNGTLQENDITQKYLEYMKSGIKLGHRRVKAIIDCGNGTTSIIARKIHELFNIDFEMMYDESDGTFPNHHPDPCVPENLKDLAKRVVETGADLGISYDGDGDRVGIIDNEGNYIPTDIYMILIIRDIINKVKNKTFLYDVKCSKALEDEIKRLGGTPICYRTGASYTQARTKELNLPFGGEFSGHVYFRDKVADMNSGIYAGLRMIEILSNTSSKLTDLTKDIPKYYATEEIKIPTDNAIKFQVIERIKELCEKQNYNLNTIDGVRINFTNGWGLVRASNTGPNITIRCESVDEKAMNDLKDWLIKLVNTYSNELKK